MLLIISAAYAEVQGAEQFFMGGKQVPREFYDAGILVNQGTALLRKNMNKEAAEKLAQAVQIAPTMAEAHHDYALALAKLGSRDAAIKEFKQALELNPTLDSAWLSLGGVYQSSGNIADALQAYREFLNRFPKHPDAPKLALLVQGLQKEFALSSGVNPPTGSADGLSSLQKAGSGDVSFVEPTRDGTKRSPTFSSLPKAGASDDYFAQATRDGVSRWPAKRMPLKVYISDASDIAGYKPIYGKVLKQTLEDWSRASKGGFEFEDEDDPRKADIEIYWQSDGRKLKNAAESGETILTKDRTGIVHGTVQLLTVPTLPEMPMTENRMRQITLHEIGHALGMTGHTTNPADAMFFSSTVEDQWKDLSQRDINTIMRLYPNND